MARGNPKLRAGMAVALAGSAKPFDGKYTLSSTRHDFSPTSPATPPRSWSATRPKRSLYGAGGRRKRTAPGR